MRDYKAILLRKDNTVEIKEYRLPVDDIKKIYRMPTMDGVIEYYLIAKGPTWQFFVEY